MTYGVKCKFHSFLNLHERLKLQAMIRWKDGQIDKKSGNVRTVNTLDDRQSNNTLYAVHVASPLIVGFSLTTEEGPNKMLVFVLSPDY